MAKSCPAVSVVPVGRMKTGKPQHFRLRAADGTTVGEARLRIADEHATVEWIEVDERGCGFGTKLYEGIADAVCKSGRTLRSDKERSDASQSFWEKQVRKGRAHCLNTAAKAARFEPGKKGRKGSHVCFQFELKCPTGKADLSGLKGRSGARRVESGVYELTTEHGTARIEKGGQGASRFARWWVVVNGKRVSGPWPFKKEAVAEARRLLVGSEVKGLGMQIPRQYEAFRPHLVHHALWDAYNDGPRPTKTSHGAIIRGMQFAGVKRGKTKSRRRSRSSRRSR